MCQIVENIKNVKAKTITYHFEKIYVSSQILSSVALLVVEVGILQELGYLKGGVFEPYWYHGVLFLNEI